MAHESPGRDFKELPESIRKSSPEPFEPLRRSWQADDALSLRFPVLGGAHGAQSFRFPMFRGIGRSELTFYIVSVIMML